MSRACDHSSYCHITCPATHASPNWCFSHNTSLKHRNTTRSSQSSSTQLHYTLSAITFSTHTIIATIQHPTHVSCSICTSIIDLVHPPVHRVPPSKHPRLPYALFVAHAVLMGIVTSRESLVLFMRRPPVAREGHRLASNLEVLSGASRSSRHQIVDLVGCSG